MIDDLLFDSLQRRTDFSIVRGLKVKFQTEPNAFPVIVCHAAPVHSTEGFLLVFVAKFYSKHLDRFRQAMSAAAETYRAFVHSQFTDCLSAKTSDGKLATNVVISDRLPANLIAENSADQIAAEVNIQILGRIDRYSQNLTRSSFFSSLVLGGLVHGARSTGGPCFVGRS
jgi:hypothetical protein